MNFSNKLREDKKALRERRNKRWKKQKIEIQREMDLDEERKRNKIQQRFHEAKMRREQILERLEKK